MEREASGGSAVSISAPSQGGDPDVERGVEGVTVGAYAGQSLQKPCLNCFSREFGSVWKTSGGQSWGDASKGPRGWLSVLEEEGTI